MGIRSVVFDDFVCDKTLMGIERFEVVKKLKNENHKVDCNRLKISEFITYGNSFYGFLWGGLGGRSPPKVSTPFYLVMK